MEIKNKTGFLEAINKIKNDSDIKEPHYHLMNLNGSSKKDFVKIEKEEFINVDFSDTRLSGFNFVGCSFNNCGFSESIIWGCLFNDCTFVASNLMTLKVFECNFISSTIINCSSGLLHFADCSFISSSFNSCNEILDVYFGNCTFESFEFLKSNIVYSRFENNFYHETPEINFKNCLLTRNYFSNLDLEKLNFSNNCQLNLNVFQNCKIGNTTFDESTNTTGQEYNSIDFSTINNSQKISEKNLKELFGILNPDIKEYVFGLTNEIKLQSVFISYSFKNKEFAKSINASLISMGVMTFLWEKDAPGGKGLKKIMKENVKKFDRVLFIASEDSLRSEACQFELTEGRKKQEKLWQDIYFPIHIDNYLFEVEKEDIRPLSKQNEYWNNIQELRQLNSVDFSSIVNDFNESDYNKMIFKLVRDLKK